MAPLGIKGHINRGNEVIEILEMLGGKNTCNCACNFSDYVYSINEKGIIDRYIPHPDSPLVIFTLEEFLKKYPYRVGDKVLYKHNKTPYFIRKMFWEKDNLLYELSDEVYSDGNSLPDTLIFDVSIAQLQPYKEETMEEKKINQMSLANCDLDEVEIILGDKFELKIKEGKYYAVKKQTQYPRTYEECCKVLCCKPIVGFAGLDDDEENLYGNFIALKRCRDAYWKIAGDWKEKRKEKAMHYVIYSTLLGEVVKDTMPNCIADYLLDFPTEEMRDAFKENFDEDIDLCKEFL